MAVPEIADDQILLKKEAIGKKIPLPPPQFNFYLFTKMKDHHLSYYIAPPSA